VGNLVVEEINDVGGFQSLGEIWNTLLPQSPDNHIFLTWEWLFIWWKYHGAGKKLRIVLVKDNGRVIAIVPLMQSKVRKGIFRFDLLENFGAQNCDTSGVILAEKSQECVDSLLTYFAKVVRDSGVIIRMWHIPENSSFISILRHRQPSFSRSFRLTERPVSSCPYIDLSATGEEHSRIYHASSHKTLQKHLRRLEKEHIVAFRKYSGDTDLRVEMEALFKLHKKRWRQKGITSKFVRTVEQDFYYDVSKYFWQNGWLNLSFIDVDGEPVSAVWGFNYAETYYDMTSSFDTDYAAYSIGIIHVMRRIEDCIRNGLTKFDFLKGDEPFKFRWAHHTVNNVQITMTKGGLTGRLRIILSEALPKIGLFRPASLWRRAASYLKTYKKGK